ncbi:MAG: tetratricopeptide repeat protein, partial [Chloroflexota bacterium]
MIKRTHMIPLAAALLAAGCNLNPLPQVVPVTEAPTEQVQATEAPTATMMPTATIAPGILLEQGDSELLNGYFENAATTYQRLVEQAGAPTVEGATAAYGMGQAAVREGLFAEAVEALTTLIEEHPQDERVAQAHYLRGEAYLGLARWSEAIADFETYLVLRPGLIDSTVYERIGDAQLALSQTDTALISYRKAADASRNQAALLALRERVAQVDASAGHTADAVAQYDEILGVAQNEAYRASIALRAAQALMDAGDTQAGLVRMNQVFTSYAEQPEAYEAMRVLLENGVELEAMARGRVSFHYGDYPAAVAAFNDYSEAQTNVGNIPAELYLMLGRAYREIGSTQAALTAFQTIIDHYSTDLLFGTALLEQGRTRFAGGDNAGAIEQYMHMVDVYDYLPEAPEALWQAGYVYSLEQQVEQAWAVFERLADSYPESAQARDGLFLAASLAYKAGELDVAERYYSEISVKTSGQEQAAAYFWVGRLALQHGDARRASVAAQAFGLAVQAAPESYFAARAADLIDARQPFTPPERVQFTFDEAQEIAEAEGWLRETYQITQKGTLSALAPELDGDARMVRGRELWSVAEYDAALAEFDDLIAANQSNALASYQLAIYFRSVGAYYSSVVAASYVIRNAQIGTLDAPSYIARLRYPAYYLDVVQEVSTRRNIDPLLIFAVIRNESLFNTYANGADGEKGLMQVMAGAADAIAADLQWANYQPAELYRPYAGIEFGAYSLEQQFRRFGENVPAALAGYDAGAGRAQAWLDLAGSDPDQLMTAIDVDSTRAYVQSVYSYYNVYRALYGAEG